MKYSEMRAFISSILGLMTVQVILAAPVTETIAALPLPQRLLHQFPDGTWVENIVVRPNGNLLVSTSTPNASVYQVHEPWTETPKVTLVHTFNEYVDRLIGIGPSTWDKFIVVGARFDTTALSGVPYNGTWATMELDFTKSELGVPRLVAKMPEAYLLQSISPLPNDESTVLISDQFLKSDGKVWRVNTQTGKYSIAIDGIAQMQTSGVEPVGINGLKVRGNHLYWVNSDTAKVYRVLIDGTGAIVPGAKVETVGFYDGFSTPDDFNFGPLDLNEIWVAGSSDNRLLVVGPGGEMIPVLGNGTNSILPQPTACAFGVQNDKRILYVTGREKKLPVNGTYFVGGYVRAVDTTRFRF